MTASSANPEDGHFFSIELIRHTMTDSENVQMYNQQVKDELYQVVKSKPSDNYDEQTDTTTEMVTTFHEVKLETNPRLILDQADRNTQTCNQQINAEVYQALKREIKCEVSDLNNLYVQTDSTTEPTNEYKVFEIEMKSEVELDYNLHDQSIMTTDDLTYQKEETDGSTMKSEVELDDNLHDHANMTTDYLTYQKEGPDRSTMKSEVEHDYNLHDQTDMTTDDLTHQKEEPGQQTNEYKEMKSEVELDYNLHHQTNMTTDYLTYQKEGPDGSTMSNATFICEHCNRQLTDESSLKQKPGSDSSSPRSNIITFDIVPRNCTKCDYKPITTEDFLRHTLLHDESRECVCSMCGYRFGSKCDVPMHIKVQAYAPKESKTTPRPVLQIQKSTVPKKQKRKNRTMLSCLLCEYKVASKARLIRHTRYVHTKERPAQCDLCDYKAVDNYMLQCHLKTHTGVKPYKCEHCDFKSVYKGNVKQHLRLHTGEKPFGCDQCHYRGAQLNNLNAHKRRHHTDVVKI